MRPPAVGVARNSAPPPVAPWVAFSDVHLGWVAEDAVDNGAPNYEITSQPDASGAGGALTQDGATRLFRHAPGSANRYGYDPALAGNNGLQRLVPNATMRSAYGNGSHSFVMAGRMSGSVLQWYGICDYVGSTATQLGAAFITIVPGTATYWKQQSNGAFYWTQGLSPQVPDGTDFTYGVSVRRSVPAAGQTTVDFYINGALRGSVANTTRDNNAPSATETKDVIGAFIASGGIGNNARGFFRGGVTASRALNASEHQICHDFFVTKT